MDTFAFIIHPIDVKRDAMRKFPFWGRIFNESQINFLSTFFPPLYISEIQGIISASTGKQIKGWFLACPYTPKRMLSLPVNTVYRKIIQTGRMAEELGAKMLGLGAFTSVVGDAGITIASELEIPITTGDAYTVSIALQAVREAATIMNIPLRSATAAVVGATGAIGRVCAEILARDVSDLFLIGRQETRLEELCRTLTASAQAHIHCSTDLNVLTQAQLIITATSSLTAIIRPEHLKPGCVICDVARPRDVSPQVVASRPDVLVIDGGMVEVPGNVNFNFDFGFPPTKAYACMAETMALTLEGCFEDYTLGKNITPSRVDEITEIAERHGFHLGGFRSFDQAVTQEQIEKVRTRVRTQF